MSLYNPFPRGRIPITTRLEDVYSFDLDNLMLESDSDFDQFDLQEERSGRFAKAVFGTAADMAAAGAIGYAGGTAYNKYKDSRAAK